MHVRAWEESGKETPIELFAKHKYGHPPIISYLFHFKIMEK